jgi:hypothetical protein
VADMPTAGLDVDYRDVAAQKRLLRERMAGLGWLAPRILAHLDHTPDFYLDQVAQVVMDRWSSGRVGLLGGRGVQLVAAVRAGHRPGPGRRLPAGQRAGRRRVGPGGRVRRPSRSHARRPWPCVPPSVAAQPRETDAHGRIADGVGSAPPLGRRMRWSPAFDSARSDGL